MAIKIGILLNSTWNAFNFREGLIKELLKREFEVVVMAPEDEYARALRDWGVRVIPTTLKQTGVNPLQDLAYLRELKKILKTERPDLLLGYTIKPNIYGALAAKPLKIPIICNVSGLGTAFLWKKWIRAAAVNLYRRAFRSAAYVFFQNKDDRKLFLSQVKMDTSRTGLLPGSGINTGRFSSEPPEFREPIRFLMVSRLLKDKGVQEYAEAAGMLLNEGYQVRFDLIGGHNPQHSRCVDTELLEKWVREGWINYLGKSNEVIRQIQDSDVVVLPSYREGTPRTLLEGGALSRPLITTDVPGCREVVEDGVNGFLCQVKSAKSLANKTRLFLALSKEEKLAMAGASRKLIEEKFDEKIVVEAYMRKISTLLDVA